MLGIPFLHTLSSICNTMGAAVQYHETATQISHDDAKWPDSEATFPATFPRDFQGRGRRYTLNGAVFSVCEER